MTKETITLSPQAINLTGKKFARLHVLRPTHRINKHIQWECRCECGNLTSVGSQDLREGHIKSCGCFKRDTPNRKTHGASKTTTYNSFISMHQRCGSWGNCQDPDYISRGISVCERWREFAVFLADMGKKPSPEHSIDRIDNDGDYCPENCRWATRTEQARNRRSNRFIAHNGETLCIADWADKLGISRRTLNTRLNRGWSESKTLDTPVRKRVGCH